MKLGRSVSPTLVIVDAQNVKNADTAALKGYDAGKKVSGIKRHIWVDTQGFPHAVALTTAQVTDRKGALQALSRCKANLGQMQSILSYGGYVGRAFAQAIKETLGEEVTVQIAKRSELHKFAVIPSAGWWSAVCLIGQKQEAVEELREKARHQPAVHPSGIPGATAQEIVNTF